MRPRHGGPLHVHSRPLLSSSRARTCENECASMPPRKTKGGSAKLSKTVLTAAQLSAVTCPTMHDVCVEYGVDDKGTKGVLVQPLELLMRPTASAASPPVADTVAVPAFAHDPAQEGEGW